MSETLQEKVRDFILDESLVIEPYVAEEMAEDLLSLIFKHLRQMDEDEYADLIAEILETEYE